MAFPLQHIGQEAEVSALSRIGLVVAIPMFLVCALLTPQLALSSRIDATANAAQTIAIEDQAPTSDANHPEASEPDGPVDLYGNEVTDAVATYRFDATGSLYETHSPQTELPRLGSPKS
jgi:hypothetical protein